MALRCHRPQHVGELFLGIAERGLAGDEVGRPGILPRPTDAHRLRLVVQPGAIRPLRREPRLDGLVVLDATALRINAQHLAGPQLSASNPAVTADVHHARLRGAANQTVLADHVAQRSQAVTVQRGADPDAVREHQAGRSIPRFHQA